MVEMNERGSKDDLVNRLVCGLYNKINNCSSNSNKIKNSIKSSSKDKFTKKTKPLI